ncbi:MAG: polysaccharide biosynthesis/export family protein [Deltaproteobacteria bacterium]|nr:polysaccharide biosynthesis/export family protein [Deltaproteobacteria bacterium]
MKKILLSWGFALLFFLLLSNGCTPRLPGVPVKELRPKILPEEIASRSLAMKEELARMTKITENAVFTEKRGYPEYRIGPLDVLEITYRAGSEQKTDTVIVRSNGMISYSFVDNIPAAGLTVGELDYRLTKRLSVYMRNPRVDILVKEFNSKTALVLGEVGVLRLPYYEAGSGKVFLKGKTTLLDLLVLAGGYTEDADIKKVKLIRADKIYYINLYDIIFRGETWQNVIIDNGDVIDVPELPMFGERVYVLGEVNRQGVYPLKNAPDLMAALAFAGSYTGTAVQENTLIIRGYEPGKKPLVLTADINAILRKGDVGQNIPLMDGDIVYVPRSTIGDVNEFIINTVPLLEYLLYPGEYRDAYWQYQDLRFK